MMQGLSCGTLSDLLSIILQRADTNLSLLVLVDLHGLTNKYSLFITSNDVIKIHSFSYKLHYVIFGMQHFSLVGWMVQESQRKLSKQIEQRPCTIEGTLFTHSKQKKPI